METSGNTLAAVKQTVLNRLLQAGISEARALAHLREGGVIVDGRVVTDPDQPANLPSRVEIRFIRHFGPRGV
jgi:hypothetical protein